MSWIFLALALGAAIFALPGGNRSVADRRVAQLIAFVGLAVALFTFKLLPLGILILLIGVGLFTMNFVKERLLFASFQNLDEDEPPSQSGARIGSRPAGGMTRAEALAVLGLGDAEDDAAINAAHRRLIARAHPDQGGTNYMAAKINEARDVLLQRR
jgi:hypothetical protein